jgi:hypothetical protein
MRKNTKLRNCLRAEIWTQDIQNAKQERYPLDHDVWWKRDEAEHWVRNEAVVAYFVSRGIRLKGTEETRENSRLYTRLKFEPAASLIKFERYNYVNMFPNVEMLFIILAQSSDWKFDFQRRIF